MRVLETNEVDQVDGGIIPAIVAVAYAAQYVAAAYTASQIAMGAGVIVGAGIVVYNNS